MSLKNQKGCWVGVGILLVFGVARVVTMPAGAQQDVIGNKAPSFELKSVTGDTVKLSDMEGKVVLLDFWAVWCGPCRKSMPFFQELQDKYGKEGLEVIGVHVDDKQNRRRLGNRLVRGHLNKKCRKSVLCMSVRP